LRMPEQITSEKPAYRYLSGYPKCMNIAHRRLAEEQLVLPIEPAWALIPNLDSLLLLC
jgi:hypothetical protein